MKDIIFIIKKENNKSWTDHEDNLLMNLTKSNDRKNWRYISSFFKKRTIISCKKRYYAKNPMYVKGKWNKTEDEKLTNLVDNFGFSWKLFSKIFRNRNEKQIRSRYINFIFKGIKRGKFNKFEDDIILKNFKNLKTNWTKYCSLLPGRSPRQIENRRTSLHKILLKDNQSTSE